MSAGKKKGDEKYSTILCPHDCNSQSHNYLLHNIYRLRLQTQLFISSAAHHLTTHLVAERMREQHTVTLLSSHFSSIDTSCSDLIHHGSLLPSSPPLRLTQTRYSSEHTTTFTPQLFLPIRSWFGNFASQRGTQARRRLHGLYDDG